MASDAPITKRLIISGLTPSISAEDISRRLTTFGTVKAADGFGLLDGVGLPKKYGYVTLETTVGKLAKCMNLLSGSTWKGAKLRFGEAKPDFRERIALENQKAAEEPPKKKKRHHNSAVYAEDMSLVTSENAVQKPGWKVSPMGRITRPVKMRPAHPLVGPLEEKKSQQLKKGLGEKQAEKKKKKRVKDPDTRARRRVIDMPKYGSTHLKGVFLDLEVTVPTKKKDDVRVEDEEPSSSSESEEENEDDTSEAVQPTSKALRPPSPQAAQPTQPIAGPSKSQIHPASPLVPPAKPTPTQPTSNTSTLEVPSDIQQEKLQSLNLLKSLFGNADEDGEDDWAGQESVGSDIDADELTKGDVMLVDGDDEPGFEVVPRAGKGDVKTKKSRPSATTKALSEEGGDDHRMEVDQPLPAPQSQPPQAQENIAPAPAQKATLKDLFAPREEEGGFSLLGHLDADIELDEDLPFLIDQAAQEPTQQKEPNAPAPSPLLAHIPPTAHVTLQNHPSASQAPIVLDPKRPLFFPIQVQGSTSLNKARQRDVFDLIKDNGWNWRDPNVGFYRSSAPNAEEEIKKRWEEVKGDLTRDWKRRHREAGKVSRRKRGGGEEGEF